jgi:anti-sigma factor RsiW
MTCDTFFSQLNALMDGELLPEAAAEAERHLLTCAECAQAQMEIAELRGMASVWTVEAPDITGRVLSAVALDDQKQLLEEMQRLRAEMQALRAEVAALRRQLPSRSDAPWTPPTRTEYSRMENDPWNLIRS